MTSVSYAMIANHKSPQSQILPCGESSQRQRFGAETDLRLKDKSGNQFVEVSELSIEIL